MTDYEFLALFNIKCQRPLQALDNLFTLIENTPKLTTSQKNLLNTIVKSSVDSPRSSIKKLNNFITTERSAGHADNVEALTKIKRNCINEITDVCSKCLDLIENKLIPENEDDPESLVYFYKVRGDIYRYIMETSPDSEDALKKASDSYLYAYTKSQEYLAPCVSIRLGAFLNYAVFKYDHLHCIEEATEILQQALTHYTEGLDKLSQESKEDVLNIVKVINENIRNWTVAESTDDSEHEEEEEEEEDQPDSPNNYDNSEEED